MTTAAAHSPAPQALEEDVTTTLYRAAIGPVSTTYYLPIFTRFEAADHAGIAWNTAAALTTFNWLVFRQLWAAALAYVGAIVAVLLLVFGIGRLVFQFSDTLMMALALGFGLTAFVLPGLFGNAVLYSECRKRMAAALAAHTDPKDACTQLERRASTRRRAISLAVANAAFWVLVLFAYLQLSSLGNLSVMPQGALESGQVAVGRTVDASSAMAVPASMPASMPAVVAASVPASAASTPASAPAPVASAAIAAASAASAPASAPATAASVAIAAASAASPRAAPKEMAKPAKPVQPPTAKPVPASPKRQASAAVAASNDKPYYVNVGLFAKPENAARVHATLLEAQLPSVAKELKSSKMPSLTRVRVGPFATQKEAQAAAEKIKALAFDAIVVRP